MHNSVGRVKSGILVHRALPVRVTDPAHRPETHVHFVPIFHKVCPKITHQKCTRYNHTIKCSNSTLELKKKKKINKGKNFNISFYKNLAMEYMERNKRSLTSVTFENHH